MSEHLKCKQCHAEMSQQDLDGVSGEQGVLKVAFQKLPAMVCPNGHKRFVSPQFPMQLLDHLAGEDEAELASGKKKGLIFKEYHCGSCDAKLPSEASGSRTFGFSVGIKGLAPFRAELTAPVYKCPSCGKEQIHSLEEMQGLTPAAMAHAFKAAGLKPE
ncbi:MAG: hypothetical protein FJY54_06850 [Betaproteobacteria bacterium]|nr:hypothetical protein [Betaproteobacteria bacterium]